MVGACSTSHVILNEWNRKSNLVVGFPFDENKRIDFAVLSRSH